MSRKTTENISDELEFAARREKMEKSIYELMEAAESSFSEADKKVLGIANKNRDAYAGRVHARAIGETVQPLQGIESDSEVAFYFEDWEDAQILYDFIMETRLVVPGEVKIKHISGQHSVHFSSEVVVNKPEVIQGALIAYEENLSEGCEDAYWNLAEEVTMLVKEREALIEKVTTSGAPKGWMDGNPFHDTSGMFTGPEAMSRSKKGSWSEPNGKRKSKVTGVGKDKKGNPLVKFGSTSHPCGRDARKKSTDKRCWDGKQGAGYAIAKAMKGKKRGSGKRTLKTSLDPETKMLIAEVHQYLDALAELV